jgi:hypothetical protein
LIRRQALEVSHDHFRADTKRLTDAIEQALNASAEQREREKKARSAAERQVKKAQERLEAECRAREEQGRLERYRPVEELGDTPQGRRFLAEDLQHRHRVSLLELSLEYLLDPTRLPALKDAVERVREAPHPRLREVYGLETAANHTLLVEEHVVGPSLLEVLHARRALRAPEVVRLLILLAPLVDHASAHDLQHVDLSLWGIHLLDQGSTSRGLDLLHRPLTDWGPLELKADAIDFVFSPTQTGPGVDPAAQLPGGAAASGPRGDGVRRLSLLAYELLGGQRTRVETTGRYTPLAALTEEGNAALRHGLLYDYPSAAELAAQMAAAVGDREPVGSVPSEFPSSAPLGRRAPGRRVWDLPQTLLEALAAHQKQKRERLEAGRRKGATKAKFEPSGDHANLANHRVSFSVFAPGVICLAQPFILDLWAYLPTQSDEVTSLARELGRDRRVGLKPDVAVARGTVLTVVLDLPSLRIKDPSDTIFWDGKPASASFIVEVPSGVAPGDHAGRIIISASGIPVAKVSFCLSIEPAGIRGKETRRELPAVTHQPRSAFASFSSQDREEVLGRVQGMTKVRPDLDVFVDVLSLRSGQNWERQIRQQIPARDVFFLFWSSHAARSKEVDKEWHIALEMRGLDYIDPIPLTDPRIAPPPQELARLHFNDLYVAHINMERERREALRRQQEKRKRLFRLALAAGVVVSGGIVYHYRPPPSSAVGDLAVETDPPGAVISLDDGSPLQAPHTFNNVKFGSHRLTATLEGYLPARQDLQFHGTKPPKIVLTPESKAMNQLGDLRLPSK